MTKSKISLASQASKTNTSNISSSSNLQKSLVHNSTLPNTRNKVFNELFYESFVEKYNEKINLWQKYYLYVKNNYLYLYDKKPKSSEKPKEYLYLNNKISVTFHRRLFKLKAIKNYVVNIKIDNEALIKSVIEDNKHNLYISFKTQNNYNNFRRIFDNVINCKEFTNNSVSPNQNGNLQMKKFKSYRHIKNKSESHIQFNNNLIEKNRNDEINSNINNKSHKSKNKMNSINKNNNSFTKSNINNVFTFSKIDGTNDKKALNSNSSKRSNSCNTNNRKNVNNLIIEEEENNNINSLKSLDINTSNNVSNSKQCINYFNVNFNENNLKFRYKEDYSSLNNNNIFYNDFSSSINLSNSNVRPNTSLIYSIRRKKEKEKEDENKMINRYKKQRRNSCYRLTFTNNKYNNIFLQKNEKKEENKIKEIKIKLKDYHSFCNIRPSKINNINISDYSRDEKNISFLNNTGTQELTNYSFNEIEEKNSECKSSKSKEKEKEKEKENDKTKNNTNTYTDMSLCSLKSYKTESKEKEKEVKDNTNFPGIDLYSYIDASDISKNRNNIEDNPTSLLETNNNNSNISKIRSQISQIIKKNEEIMSKSQNNKDNEEEKDNESDTNIIFTSRIREEMTENNSIKKESESSNSKEKTKENYDDINDTTKNEISSNEGCSNIMNTSNIHQINHLRFSSDLNDLIQNLENVDNKNKNNKSNKMAIPFDSFFKRNLDINYLDFNIDSIINDKNMMKMLISKIDNNEIFIYDSYICDLLLSKIKETLKSFNSIVEQKGNTSKNRIIGKIYESINNKYAKYFLLCEMISIISKYELSKIVINAIEINNKKKEINKDESDVNYDEYVFKIFNKYLSRNEKNDEYKRLYEEILPKKIKEYFQIKDSEGSLSNIFKNEIHPNTLFNSMQYHNKIYFYNIDIENDIFPDFNSLNPLNNNFKFYISPYILEKWKCKASLEKGKSPCYNEMNKNEINSIEKDKEEEMLRLNKKYEKSEEAEMLNLFHIILSKINQNEVNLALKICEYFLEKFKRKTSVLYPLVYLCISFIYSKVSNHELSEEYFKKYSQYINTFFPKKNNFLFFELEYKHLSMLLNNKEEVILENVENIMNIFENCGKLWKKFYGESENIELKMDKIIFEIYFRINEADRNNENFLNNLYYNNIRLLIGEFEDKLKERKDIFKLCVKLFIEFFKKCPSYNLSIFNDLINYYNSFQ